MRILAVDPGEKRIGIAVSDPSQTLASPREVIQHISKTENALRIIETAEKNVCVKIIIGLALNADGQDTLSSRRARNLASEIAARTEIPVVLWDEAGSTKAAAKAAFDMGLKRKKRRGHLDANAAAIILQSYLDSQKEA